jgi:hypothetical protein
LNRLFQIQLPLYMGSPSWTPALWSLKPLVKGLPKRLILSKEAIKSSCRRQSEPIKSFIQRQMPQDSSGAPMGSCFLQEQCLCSYS